MGAEVDKVFKALAAPERRLLLDRLRADNGQTLGQLCTHLEMTRQAVTRHLNLLEEATLVVTIWQGREKLHYLNPMPIHEIAGAGSANTSEAVCASSPNSNQNWR